MITITLSDAIFRHATWYPDRIAFKCGEKSVTWKEFNRRVNKVSNLLLSKGMEKGDKVSVLMNSSIEMAVIIFGVTKVGGVIVPLSTMATGETLALMIDDSDSKYIFVDSQYKDIIAPYSDKLTPFLTNNNYSIGFKDTGWVGFEDLLSQISDEEPLVELSYDDDFNIIYSSGTTGIPKGIVHTQYARLLFTLGLIAEFRVCFSSISILTTPLFTNGTWMLWLPTVFVGGTTIIMPQFDPQKFLELVQEEKCTHTFMVPTQFIFVMSMPGFEDFDTSTMQIMVTGGAPLMKQTKEEIMSKFNAGLLELYGCTEGVGSTLKPEEMQGKIGSVGKPMAGMDLRIIDDHNNELPWGSSGEIVGRSAATMREYYKKPDITAEAVWKDDKGRTFIRTGDIGKVDEDGYLYLLERKKDMIISGGINVFSVDLEEVIAKHPDVDDVAVIGIPSEKWGETPVALVVPKRGSKITESELKEWANNNLSKYQRLSRVEFIEDVPRNILGKILKRQLREQYQEKLC